MGLVFPAAYVAVPRTLHSACRFLSPPTPLLAAPAASLPSASARRVQFAAHLVGLSRARLACVCSLWALGVPPPPA
eukprot:2106911-Rhodomonas_salina.2